MLQIAIDGACRGNGKPECVSAGGVFIFDVNTDKTRILTAFESHSTSQRGELIALQLAMNEVYDSRVGACIITDSEYIFNTMAKEWYKGWESRSWRTATLGSVKNVDLWKSIAKLADRCYAEDIGVTFYYIKGHCISFGKKTASTLLSTDETGMSLYRAVVDKYQQTHNSKLEALIDAQELSEKNNGYALPGNILQNFVVMNTVADAIATRCVESVASLFTF